MITPRRWFAPVSTVTLRSLYGRSNVMPSKNYVSQYTLESMDPYLSGVKEWPVITELHSPMPDCLFLLLGASISATHVRWLFDSEGNRCQCRYFLIHTQGGSLTGEAYALYSHWHMGVSKVRLVKVAVCYHRRVSSGTREQERRGWYPARCGICGLDMTVDSGD